MKVKQIVLMIMAVLLIGGVTAIQQVTAQEQGANILVNSSFEEGHHRQDNLSEITVPNGWKMHWLDGQAFAGIHEDLVARRPETVVWNANGGIPAGEEVLWRDGIYTFKIFKGWAPMYAALSQDVSGLEVGRKYRLIAPIFADIYDWDGKKIPPWDQNHGLVRLGASPVGTAWLSAGIQYSPFAPSTYGQYQNHIYEFVATNSEMTIWVEVAASYPHANNGFFTDVITMHPLDAHGTVPSSGNGSAPQQTVATFTPMPTPTPRADGAVVHIVGGADSLWSVAIQYAETLEMSPADALTHIRNLNDNPKFIYVGQELMIIEPNVEAEPIVEATPTVESLVAADGETALESEEATATSEEVSSEEAVPEMTDTPAPVVNDEVSSGAVICISAYNDASRDGVRGDAEPFLANVIFTITRAGNTIATYVSDGVNEPYCFENLEADTYQVQFDPPANYIATSPINWAVSLSDNASITADFGAREVTADEIAQAAASDSADAVATAGSGDGETAVESPSTSDSDAANESGGFMDNMGSITIGIAVVLALLAGAGVLLLRRS